MTQTKINDKAKNDVIAIKDIFELDINSQGIGAFQKSEKWLDWCRCADEDGVFKISPSALKAVRKQPIGFMVYKNKNKTTPSMAYGSMMHHWILQRGTFSKKFYVLPSDTDKASKKNKADKIGKDEWKLHEAIAKERGIKSENIIKKSDFQKAALIGELFQNEPTVNVLLDRIIETEKEMFTDVLYKGHVFEVHQFIDGVLTDGGILDIKNVANIFWWEKTLRENGDFMQLFINLLCLVLSDKNNPINQLRGDIRYRSAENYVLDNGKAHFLVANSDGVLPAQRMTQTHLNIGLTQFHEALNTIIKCHFTGNWTRSYSYNLPETELVY